MFGYSTTFIWKNITGEIKRHLIMILDTIDNYQLSCYVPLFIELIKQRDIDITKFVLDKCVKTKSSFLFAWGIY